MSQTTGLTTLFRDADCKTIELLNHEYVPVGALYLDTLNVRMENVVISETKTSEKYLLYLDGISIFFTYYRKI